MIGHLYTLLLLPSGPTPPTGVGKSAWMRTWLQEQYKVDFKRYEAEREAKKVALKAPEPVAKAPPPAVREEELEEAPARPVLKLPIRRVVSVLAPEPMSLPPEVDLDTVRRAARKNSEVHLRADEEEAVLMAAAVFGL